MSDVNRGQFYNNPEQAIKYSEMVNHAYKFKNKEGNFLDNTSSLNIAPNDNDMYYAYNFAILGQTMRETRLQLIGNSTNNVCLEENLRMLAKEFFPVTGYMDRIIDANNSYYKTFNHPSLDKYNPWVIDKNKENVMDSEFGSALGYNSRIELIAKNMLWTNRATKELDIIRRHIVEEKAGDRRKCRTYGKKFENIVEKILLDQDEYDGQALSSEFLDKFSAHVYGEYDIEEMKEQDSYKKVEEIKNNEASDITMEEVFKYLSLSTAETTLYQMKTRFVELAIKEIGELKKARKMNGIKVCKSSDNNSKSNTYNTRLQIVIPGYNSPFTVHANNTHLTDLSTKYNVNYENKDLHNPCLAVCTYKYNNKQIEQIKNLEKTSIASAKIRRCVDYAGDRCQTGTKYER